MDPGLRRGDESGAPVLRVPVPLEVGDQRRAEVAIGLVAGIGGAVAAEEVERLLPDATDAAVDDVVAGLTGSGIVSARSNRVAFRVSEEPLDLFRRYAAVYAREQALCHFSPALIANLERHWNAANRRM